MQRVNLPRLRFSVGFILIAGVLLFAGCEALKLGQSTDDRAVTTQIQAKLFDDPVLRACDIHVASDKGTVTPRNSVLPYLAGFILAPFVGKGLLSEKWVSLGQCVIAAQVAYETGALLGYRFREQMPTFAKLFCEPGHETELATYLKESTRAEMSRCQGESMTFFRLRWETDVAFTMEAMRRAGRTKLTDTGDFHLIAGERIRAVDVSPWLQTVTAKGIGLGSGLPQLMEKLWRNSYELPMGEEDVRAVAQLRAHGLELPQSLAEPESLEAAQARAVSWIIPYISHHCPEMMQELGL